MSSQQVVVEQAEPRAWAVPWVLVSYVAIGLAALLPRVLDLGRWLSGDEASFTVELTATIPADYLETAPDAPDGPGSLGSRFEIDGNLVKDGAGPGLDWGSAGLALINVLDPPLTSLAPDYLTDNAFTDGAKEDHAVPTVLDASVPPNKSDLTNWGNQTRSAVS